MSMLGALVKQAVKQNQKLDAQNLLIAAQNELLVSIIESTRGTQDAVDAVRVVLQVVEGRLPRKAPGQMFVLEIEQMSANRFRFSLGLPALAAHDDTVKRKLWTSINGSQVGEPMEVDVDAEKVPGNEGNEDDNFEFTLRDYDEKGNESDASTLEFVLTDTVPPPQPGSMSIMDMEQIPSLPEPTV